MKLELLISALKADPDSLIKTMGVSCDAVLINQCDEDSFHEFPSGEYGTVKVFSCTDRGIGVSRNKALFEASADILLFSDDDIVYEPGFDKAVLDEFNAHPEADGIFFNVDVDPSRRTYHTEIFGPVTMRGSGRYPTYSLAIRRDSLRGKDIRFSTLFGGGARYSCGEDSLFIVDCLKNGLKLYKSPLLIGHEVLRESTWFKGFTEKFFFDRGVLYHFLYGKLAYPLGVRFLLKHRKEMCREIPFKKALSLIKQGIKEGRKVEKKEGRI